MTTKNGFLSEKVKSQQDIVVIPQPIEKKSVDKEVQVSDNASVEVTELLFMHNVSVAKLAEILDNYDKMEICSAKDKKQQTEKEKMLYLSSHIDVLTDDIEKLQNSLMNTSHDANNGEQIDEIREEVDDLSPIAEKNGASTWSVNEGSHVFNECGNNKCTPQRKEDPSFLNNKENKPDMQVQYSQIASRLSKLQEEYGKVKAKMLEYQQNNTTYLEEIKTLKEQLSVNTNELNQIKAKKSKEKENSGSSVGYTNVSLKEITECKRRISELERMLEGDKEKIIQLENKCLKLKLEKEQLGIRLEKRSPLLDYLKTGLPSIIEKMVQLIIAIEQEARNLMQTIKKYKLQKKTPSKFYEGEDSDENEDKGSEKGFGIGRHRVSSSLEKIGCLEKEIKQICSRISNLNKCVNIDSDEEGEEEIIKDTMEDEINDEALI